MEYAYFTLGQVTPCAQGRATKESRAVQDSFLALLVDQSAGP